jgi:thymidylate synthase (FAD)
MSNSYEFKTDAARVYCLAFPSFEEDEFARFLHDVGQTWRSTSGASKGENLVEVAGRICYMSFGERQSTRTNREYIVNLLSQGHESVLEHATWTFLITGVSRSFSHQLVRHRPGFSFSQLSQQYHDERNSTLVIPSAIQRDPLLLAVWSDTVGRAQWAYRELLNALESPDEGRVTGPGREWRRRVRSAARSVLPEATATKIVVTANARALRHFFEVRGGLVGDEEMRRVSALLLDVVNQTAPNLFFDFEIRQHSDDLPIVVRVQGEGRNENAPSSVDDG